MKSRDLTEREMDAERADLASRPRYAPGAEGRGTARFRFDLDPAAVGESLFAISSRRANAVVYLGPYHPELLVGKDSGLSSDRGYDSLEIRLVEIEHKRVRSWANDRGHPYWAAEGTIEIALRDEEREDEDGLLEEHGVKLP